VAGEIFMRLTTGTRYQTPAELKAKSVEVKPSIFTRYVLPREDRTYDGWEGGKWHINRHGYRGRDFSSDKPEGIVRIIVYGGSSVFDPSSDEGEDWPHGIETLLKERGFGNVEVINAGISGHASFDSVGRLFAEGHLFDPDYVLLYNAWNDMEYFQWKEPLLRKYSPYEEENNPFTQYQSWLDRLLCEYSQLYLMLREKYYKLKLRPSLEGKIPEGEYSSKIDERGLNQYALNVRTFVDLARNIGAVPILVTQARLVTPDNTAEQKRRIKYERHLLTHEAVCEAYESMDGILKQVAREKNVPLVDASKELTGKDELFKDHVHLRRKGSKDLAEVIADNMERLLIERK
jgi:lysophospholipase L1-like esterase